MNCHSAQTKTRHSFYSHPMPRMHQLATSLLSGPLAKFGTALFDVDTQWLVLKKNNNICLD